MAPGVPFLDAHHDRVSADAKGQDEVVAVLRHATAGGFDISEADIAKLGHVG